MGNTRPHDAQTGPVWGGGSRIWIGVTMELFGGGGQKMVLNKERGRDVGKGN